MENPFNGNALIECPACNQHTEVTREVHMSVGLLGMRIGCWACGAQMKIPPTGDTVEYERRQAVDAAMLVIAYGDRETGKDYLRYAERIGRSNEPTEH